ncbi:MAG: 2OG-Fe(II) oxygenase [Terricaulis sp.]
MTDFATLQQRAQKGDTRALAELGARLMFGRAAPYAPADGASLLHMAADRRDAFALQFMGVLAAVGEGRPQSWTAAFDFLKQAASVGDKRAKEQLAIVGDVAAVEQNWLRAPPAVTRIEAQRVSTIEGFLSREACAWIINRARPALSEAMVKNPQQGGANADAMRSNTGMGFSIVDTDLVLQLTHARIANAMGLDVRQQEPTNILHYDIGQQYKLHFDYLDPGEAHFARELQQMGQRIATFLIYLNDDYEGGETSFPRLDWSFKGRAGDALIFWNVTPDGKPDKQTLHAGTAPTSGTKWLFSKWVRDRALPLL